MNNLFGHVSIVNKSDLALDGTRECMFFECTVKYIQSKLLQ